MCAFFSRGPNKIQHPYTLVDIYNSYISETDPDSPYYVDYNTFMELNKVYLQGIVEYILTTALEFKLPYRLGSFQIIKKKITYKNQHKNFIGSIDWQATNLTGKQVFYTNDHSDGYKYFFTWHREEARVENKSKYRFIPCRTVKRRLAYIIKNKVKDYFERG